MGDKKSTTILLVLILLSLGGIAGCFQTIVRNIPLENYYNNAKTDPAAIIVDHFSYTGEDSVCTKVDPHPYRGELGLGEVFTSYMAENYRRMGLNPQTGFVGQESAVFRVGGEVHIQCGQNDDYFCGDGKCTVTVTAKIGRATNQGYKLEVSQRFKGVADCPSGMSAFDDGIKLEHGIARAMELAGLKLSDATLEYLDKAKTTIPTEEIPKSVESPKSKSESPEDAKIRVLREYKKLLDEGVITQEQFEKKRDEVMGE
jgi:hypothetical protein